MRNAPSIHIVDDNTARASAILRAANRLNLTAIWFRPANAIDTISNTPSQIVLTSVSELAEILKKQARPSLWLWDVHLYFASGEEQRFQDYSPQRPLFDAMLGLMQKDHVFVFTSDQYKAPTRAFEKAGAPRSSFQWVDAIDRDAANADDAIGEKALEVGLDVFTGSLSSSLARISKDHFGTFDNSNLLPHVYFGPESCPHLPSILHEITLASPAVISSLLSGNERAIFEILKTFIGSSAKLHSEEGGYEPSIGILPLLLLRAMIKSKHWTDSAIIELFERVEWANDLRHVRLSSLRQDRSHIWEWLAPLADVFMPAIVVDPSGTGPALLHSIELNSSGRLFKLEYKSEWAPMFAKVDRNESDGGNVFRAWYSITDKLGSCGASIGRETLCNVNLYASSGTTHIDFRVAHS